jgi:hypothetical protein
MVANLIVVERKKSAQRELRRLSNHQKLRVDTLTAQGVLESAIA